MPDRWLRGGIFEQHVITKFVFISFEILCDYVWRWLYIFLSVIMWY